MSKLFPLKVIQVIEETKDAKSIVFQIPEDLKETFKYKSGQYLTLSLEIRGEEVRRAYSLCSSPYSSNDLKVGVKRVKGGLVSNYLNDHIKIGDTIEVMPPMGDFSVEVDHSNYKSYYLFAAGSGITPILSILKSILKVEDNSHVYMAYGNRNQDSIIFNQELKQLQQQYKDRFKWISILSKPKSGLSRLFSSKNKDYEKGRIDEKFVHQFIKDNPPYAQNTAYFICGPEAMITNTKKALEQIDVPTDRINIEYFGTSTSSVEDQNGVDNANLKAIINDVPVEVKIPKSKTILRTLLDNNHDVPFSCEGGVCGMCRCQLTKGEVAMANNLALDEQDIESGFILACQSVPLTDSLEIIIND